MLQLVVFILCNFGMAYNISQAKITKSTREFVSKKSIFWGEFMTCCLCIGLWTSLISYYLVYGFINKEVITAMFIGSITAHILYLITKKLQ
jgi:uncharacterized protein (DUF2062 family)